MLVLARKIDEVILIGDSISIKVLGFIGNKVRIGIIAPPGVAVDREEIRFSKEQGKRRIQEGDL